MVAAATSPAGDIVAVHEGVVIRVVDGDSLYLEGERTQIRLFGIDAPERNEEGFDASTDQLKAIAFGKRLSCNELYRDHFERIIARCFLPDRREVNRLMLDEPHTHEYCKYSKNV